MVEFVKTQTMTTRADLRLLDEDGNPVARTEEDAPSEWSGLSSKWRWITVSGRARNPDPYDRRGSQKSRRLMIQRLLRDESGMTMGLAIMMILLISVMGAGLLTFVSRDLNTVIEENRGQRAFEVADAGIEAAKRQFASDASSTAPEVTSTTAVSDDIQWSVAEGGLTLNDLDGDDTTDRGQRERHDRVQAVMRPTISGSSLRAPTETPSVRSRLSSRG